MSLADEQYLDVSYACSQGHKSTSSIQPYPMLLAKVYQPSIHFLGQCLKRLQNGLTVVEEFNSIDDALEELDGDRALGVLGKKK